MMKSRNIGITKSIVYALTVILAFFIFLETAQRIRYSFKFKSPFWLVYGFVKKPKDYLKMQERGLRSEELGFEVIEVRVVRYDGYRKNNPKCTTTDYYINSFGFRGKEFKIDKRPGIYRIIALGGSTTFGSGVKDGFTYPDQLEKILNGRSSGKYEVINAGLGANVINEIANLFRKEVIALSPDMIIINSVFNNFYFDEKAYTYQANLLQKINQFFLKKSLFYMTLREKIAYLSRKPIGDIYKAPTENIFKNFMEDNTFWQQLKNNYKDIIDNAKTNGIKILIIKQPIRLLEHGKNRAGILLDKRFGPVYQRAYELLDEFRTEDVVEILDIASEFNKLPEDKKDMYFQSDSLHLTCKGNEYLASLVARSIE